MQMRILRGEVAEGLEVKISREAFPAENRNWEMMDLLCKSHSHVWTSPNVQQFDEPVQT